MMSKDDTTLSPFEKQLLSRHTPVLLLIIDNDAARTKRIQRLDGDIDNNSNN